MGVRNREALSGGGGLLMGDGGGGQGGAQTERWEEGQVGAVK